MNNPQVVLAVFTGLPTVTYKPGSVYGIRVLNESGRPYLVFPYPAQYESLEAFNNDWSYVTSDNILGGVTDELLEEEDEQRTTTER